MKSSLFVCADSSAVDIESNRLSIFNLLEDLGASSFPVVVPQISIIAMLTRTLEEPSKAAIELRFALDKESLGKVGIDIDFQDKLRVRNINVVQGIALPRPGTFQVTLHYENRRLGAWTITANQAGQPKLVQKASTRSKAERAASSTQAVHARQVPRKKAE